MKTLINCLAVGGAGFVGALARYGVSILFTRVFGATYFPVATLVINVTGSFLLGWFITFMGTRYAGPWPDTVRLAVAVGFVGAYTTFSTYMFETDKLMHDGARLAALGYLFASLALGLLAVELGMRWAR